MDTRIELSRFIILIPHRDALRPFEEYRRSLFAAGFPGAYSFPAAAPLARVSRPFKRGELTELARNIRSLTRNNGGKILSACTALAGCPGNFSFFGPRLNLPVEEAVFPESAKNALFFTFSPPLLCGALAGASENPAGEASEKAPALSFRAAALANLAIRPLASGEKGYSFEWKIGPLVWLPKHKGD